MITYLYLNVDSNQLQTKYSLAAETSRWARSWRLWSPLFRLSFLKASVSKPLLYKDPDDSSFFSQDPCTTPLDTFHQFEHRWNPSNFWFCSWVTHVHLICGISIEPNDTYYHGLRRSQTRRSCFSRWPRRTSFLLRLCMFPLDESSGFLVSQGRSHIWRWWWTLCWFDFQVL